MPEDEQARLEALRSIDVLDTPPEERFDQLTRMAKRLFGVPIALVSIVDENRQWFKSCVGLDVIETSRDISFCGHAILGNDVFIIPDTFEDPRFADNPLVLNDPGIRFYAGCPLTVGGHKLGTLCIIDKKPREFGEEDVNALKDLASMVERELLAIQLASLDDLTKVSNRRGFLFLAKYSLKLCTRQKIPATLAFLDMDKFKAINDEFGHSEGDFALTTFASLMKASLRDSDLFARWGGDEFVALLTDTTREQAQVTLERCSQLLAQYTQEAKLDYAIAFSFGAVEFDPNKHTTIEALLADGDSLMYKVKQARN